LHRLCAVLDLRLLVLLRDDQAGRDVRDPDGGVRRVHALTAGAARAERVDAAARFRRRDALDAVHAALVLQPAVDPLTFDERDDFLDAARAAVAQVQDLELPAVAFRVPRIHAE